VQHDAFKLLIREVLEAEGVVEPETTRQPSVDLTKHLLHLFLVANHDDSNVLSRRAVDQADHCVDRLVAIRRVVERVRLVDDEHLARAPLQKRRRPLWRLTHRRTDQVAGLLELTLTIAQKASGFQDPAVQLSHCRLSSPRVAKKKPIERDVV